jgi:GNAT superfamily N-acetyltransferase
VRRPWDYHFEEPAEAATHCQVNKVRRIEAGEFDLYKRLRLDALKEDPAAFVTTYEEAISRSDESWRNQADEAATSAERALFFAFVNETAAGLAGLYRDQDNPQAGEFIQVWIAPPFRKRGLAMQLIEFAADWARKRQLRTVKAIVAKENAGVISFYEKCGFSRPPLNIEVSDQELTLQLKMRMAPTVLTAYIIVHYLSC